MMLVRDPDLRQRMGQISYDRIQAYDVHKMAEQYEAIYAQAIAKP